MAVLGSRWLRAIAVFVGSTLAHSQVIASPIFSVTFNDPAAAYTPYYSQITSHVTAAGSSWGAYLPGVANLEVVVGFSAAVPTANGGSVTSAFAYNNGTYNVFQQGAAHELETGIDSNGAAPDIQITLGDSYLANELWFDPDPFVRSALVPLDRTDAVSVFLHEIGHALAFNGWRDWVTGALPGDYESTFDELIVSDGSNFYFAGTAATSLYGGLVPLTYGNLMHVGNSAPRPGVDLVPDLMNGVVFFRGSRYSVSGLDLAVLADSAVTVQAVPEPGTLMMVGAGIASLSARRLRKRKAIRVSRLSKN